MHVAPDTITSIDDETDGQFLILTTTGSLYLLHLSNRTQMRVRFDDDDLAVLRRDGELVDLLRLIRVTVGAPMVLWLDIRRDGIPTLRTTSPVVSIRGVIFDDAEPTLELTA